MAQDPTQFTMLLKALPNFLVCTLNLLVVVVVVKVVAAAVVVVVVVVVVEVVVYLNWVL